MISMDKTYRYRHGGAARILAIDAPGSRPVISMSTSGSDTGSIYRHSQDGVYSVVNKTRAGNDLIEVQPDNIRYARVYKDASVSHASKTIPNDDGCGLGFVKITVPDGGTPTFEWNPW